MAHDLDFAGQKTAYASHGLHSFAAKFPPQLARWGIEAFSRPGETVLDPMVGSGTTLVEARLLGRDALGADIDPLARLIARVKATPLQPELLAAATSALLADLEADFAELRRARAHAIPFRDAFRDVPIPEFPNRDYWFLPEVSEELALLRRRIDAIGPYPAPTPPRPAPPASGHPAPGWHRSRPGTQPQDRVPGRRTGGGTRHPERGRKRGCMPLRWS
ncbi:MAG TPA: DNA methyltransferase [Chloroflexota bacterium]|nr:DNA methyltransferase [Chloroflexota bacterium]